MREVKNHLLAVHDIESLRKKRKSSLVDFREEIGVLCQNFNEKWMDKSKLALQKVQETKEAITINVKNILERNNQIQDIEDKTLIMTENSEILMKNANTLKRKT